MKQKAIHSRNSAFTLVEILVCVVLFSGLIITVSSMYSFIRRTFISVDGKAAACAKTERMLLRIDSELRSARDVIEPSSNTRAESLNFYTKEGNQISYEFADGKVTRTESQSGNSRVVLEKAEMVSFSRFSPGLVEILVSSQGVSVLTAVHVWNLP